MASRWEHLFTDALTVAPVTARSSGGDPTFGTRATVRGRLERGVSLKPGIVYSRTPQHRFVTDTDIALTSAVWLPGDDTNDTNKAIRPVAVDRAGTPDGATLYSVLL